MVDGPIDLISAALRLKQTEKALVKAVIESDREGVAKYLAEFVELRRDIKVAMLQHPVIQVPEATDPEAKRILRKVSAGEPFGIERATEGTGLGDALLTELGETEIDELGRDLFYVWFSHHDYIVSLYEVGSLVLSVGTLPDRLVGFVDEAKSCYAFQQYSAVCALCRMMLEIAVKDMAIHCGVLRGDQDNVRSLERRGADLHGIIESLCELAAFSKHRAQLHQIRRRGNQVIHGNKEISAEDAKQLLQDTLLAINDLYENANTET